MDVVYESPEDHFCGTSDLVENKFSGVSQDYYAGMTRGRMELLQELLEVVEVYTEIQTIRVISENYAPLDVRDEVISILNEFRDEIIGRYFKDV